jgi:hypothetical protein
MIDKEDRLGQFASEQIVELLRSTMLNTLGVVEWFLSDVQRQKVIPKSSIGGKICTMWKEGDRLDEEALPIGNLLQLGGAADRVTKNATSEIRHITEDGIIEISRPAPILLRPTDDFRVLIKRTQDSKLALNIECVPNPSRFSTDEKLKTLGVGIHDLEDLDAARILIRALGARVENTEAKELLKKVVSDAIRIGCIREQNNFSWAMPKEQGTDEEPTPPGP